MSLLALTEAVNAGQTAKLQSLLPKLSGTEREEWLDKSLLRAAYENRIEAVRSLLEVKARPTCRDDLKKTPLHWAARQANEGVARILCERGAETNAPNQDGVTPLHLAAEFNAGGIVKLVLAHKGKPDSLTKDNRTPLHVAADHGSAVAAAVLLDGRKDTSLLELESDRGETPLARAATRGHAPVVQLLLKAKANAGHRNFWGQSPLQLAAHSGHVGCAAVLLDCGAQVGSAAQDGTTPLYSASDRCFPQVVELLLAHGADVKVLSAGGRTPLHTAAERGCAEAVDALVAHQADVEALTDESRTPLSLAAARGHKVVIERLLDLWADIQALDNVQSTPLHAAAAAGRAEAVDALCHKRARVEDKDAAGRTPMDLALAGRHDGAIRRLVRHGAHMPEEFANTPEMRKLIEEVESEVIAEQMKEGANAEVLRQLEQAEKDFEEARRTLLRLSEQSIQVYAAPALHAAEMKCLDAEKLAKDKIHAQNNSGANAKTLFDDITAAKQEMEARRKALETTRDRIRELSNLDPKRRARIKELEKKTVNEREEGRKAEEKLVSLGKLALEWEAKVPPEEEKIVLLREEGVQTAEKLEKIRTSLHKWHEEKETARKLHAQAHSLLDHDVNTEFKPKKRVDSPSPPASPGGGEGSP